MGFLSWTVNKLNPAQQFISNGGTTSEGSREPTWTYQQYYERLEIINRGVNMLVDDVSAVPMVVGDAQKGAGTYLGLKKKTVDRLLNVEPNPYQDINSFRRLMLMDLILDGNIFLYFDGEYLYNLPATRMTVVSDPKTFVNCYKFDGEGGVTYSPDEIIHVKDNSFKTIFRGSSRLEPGLATMRRLTSMLTFQDNFFKNGATPGLVLMTDNTLNERMKQRLTAEWSAKYRPTSGGKKPIILDGGLRVDPISNVSFSELDFETSVENAEKKLLKLLGVPPVLIDSGNNANLRPNQRLYYLETIIPIVNKICSAMARFFGFDIYEDTTYIEALRPELKDQAAYLQGLVNGGIMTANEARAELGKPPLDGHDDLRIPQNIAGSAADPTQGGAPPSDDNSGE